MCEVNGIKYVNDSKATTVEAVLRALSAFSEPIVLILGGKDKGNDYSRMRDAVKKNVRTIVAVGHSAEKIVHNLRNSSRKTRRYHRDGYSEYRLDAENSCRCNSTCSPRGRRLALAGLHVIRLVYGF